MSLYFRYCPLEIGLRASAVDESTRGQKAEHVDPKPNHKKIDSYSSNAMGHDNAAPQGFNFLIVVSRPFSLLLDSTFFGGVESLKKVILVFQKVNNF